MGNTGVIEVFLPPVFQCISLLQFLLGECKATVGSGQKLSTQGCVNIKSAA